METTVKCRSAKDFKIGQVILTKSLILGKVINVSDRYVTVQDGDGNIRVTIPAHGEIRVWEP